MALKKVKKSVKLAKSLEVKKSKYDLVFEAVLKKCVPKRDFSQDVTEVLFKIQSNLNKRKIVATVMLGGSFAKKTYLEGDFDCDVFVRFDFVKYKNADLSLLLESVLDFPKVRVHGSRDYFQATLFDINFEIVPVLYVEDSKKGLNVTDSSPLHVIWFNKHNKNLNNDIRLAKVFCKANRIYGAESHIKGFSGHVLDILVIYYGGFLKLLKASSKWIDGTVIDISKHYEGKLNESKLSPLIVIDPINSERNAAAALSLDKIKIFKTIAADFLKSPSISYFEKKPLDMKKISGINSCIMLEIIPLDGKKDVVGSKILKAIDFIKNSASNNDFEIVNVEWDFDMKRTFVYFIYKDIKMSDFKIIEGPPLRLVSHVESFKAANKNCFLKGDKIYSKMPRRYLSFKTFLKDCIKEKYIGEKVAKARIISK